MSCACRGMYLSSRFRINELVGDGDQIRRLDEFVTARLQFEANQSITGAELQRLLRAAELPADNFVGLHDCYCLIRQRPGVEERQQYEGEGARTFFGVGLREE